MKSNGCPSPVGFELPSGQTLTDFGAADLRVHRPRAARVVLRARVASRRAERRAVSEYRCAWRRLARIRGDHRRPAATSPDALPDQEDSAGPITASQTEGKEGRSC